MIDTASVWDQESAMDYGKSQDNLVKYRKLLCFLKENKKSLFKISVVRILDVKLP